MTSLRQRKKDRTRWRLALAAVHLLATEGDERTTVAAVAERAGVSPRTFHNYFSRREEAFLHFVEMVLSHWEDGLRAAPEDEPPVRTLRRIFLDTARGGSGLCGPAPEGVDGEAGESGAATDAEALTPFHLLSLGDHIAVSLGREDRERAHHLFDGLGDLIHERSGGELSPFRARLLLHSCLAAAGTALEFATRRREQGGDRSLESLLEEAMDALEEGFSA